MHGDRLFLWPSLLFLKQQFGRITDQTWNQKKKNSRKSCVQLGISNGPDQQQGSKEPTAARCLYRIIATYPYCWSLLALSSPGLAVDVVFLWTSSWRVHGKNHLKTCFSYFNFVCMWLNSLRVWYKGFSRCKIVSKRVTLFSPNLSVFFLLCSRSVEDKVKFCKLKKYEENVLKK